MATHFFCAIKKLDIFLLLFVCWDGKGCVYHFDASVLLENRPLINSYEITSRTLVAYFPTSEKMASDKKVEFTEADTISCFCHLIILY